MWLQSRFKVSPNFGKHGCVTTNFPPSLLHLGGQKFCLLLQSSTITTRESPELAIQYLNCLILDVSPIFNDGTHKDKDDDDEEEDEDDDDNEDEDNDESPFIEVENFHCVHPKVSYRS